MATIAIPRPIPSHRSEAILDGPITPPLSLQGSSLTSTSASHSHAPIPNKHIPVCPSGSGATEQLDTPPESPRSADDCHNSVLSTPHVFPRLDSGRGSIYQLGAPDVVDAINLASRQQLPDPSVVFPWFHGLHPHNHLQQGFFNARRRLHRKPPSCMRAVTVVKADGDLNVSRIKGAITPAELIHRDANPEFIEADPREGFSVRNFHIQQAKVALISDIIVYGDDVDETRNVAWDFAAAQAKWRQRHIGEDYPHYNTFFCVNSFSEFEEEYGHVVAVDSEGYCTGKVLDFGLQEKLEMWKMTEASEISHNVSMGPTPEQGSPEEYSFNVLIECSDGGCMNPHALQLIAEMQSDMDQVSQRFHEFPSSGSILPPTWTQSEADGILETCKWMYHLANGTRPARCPAIDVEGDSFMDAEEETASAKPLKILIHCGDGYTESTLLAIAYFSYSTGRPVPDAWLNLHTTKRRNFFAYPSDVALLTAIAPRLLHESPVCADKTLSDITNLVKNEPSWLPGLDGSFPSRILDYMYLGNLGHANNPDLLRELGITQLLSVGETAIWRDGDMETWGEENVCHVEGVQDNGIDPLTDQFNRCLEFIGTSPSPFSPIES